MTQLILIVPKSQHAPHPNVASHPQRSLSRHQAMFITVSLIAGPGILNISILITGMSDNMASIIALLAYLFGAAGMGAELRDGTRPRGTPFETSLYLLVPLLFWVMYAWMRWTGACNTNALLPLDIYRAWITLAILTTGGGCLWLLSRRSRQQGRLDAPLQLWVTDSGRRRDTLARQGAAQVRSGGNKRSE